MRKDSKSIVSQQSNSQLMSIDLHNFVEREGILTELEISRELGISINDVQKLKRQMKR